MILGVDPLPNPVGDFFVRWWNTIDVFLTCALPVLLAFFGWLIGRTVERLHFRRLAAMEERLLSIPISDTRAVPPGVEAGSAVMIVGSVVLATDYFRTFLTSLRKLIGGEIGIYGRLLERARREAICRMMMQAHKLGAKAVVNLRIETSNIGGITKNPAPMCEVVAYGTAILEGECTK